MHNAPNNQKKKQNPVKSATIKSVKFACVGIGAIGLALASGPLLSAAVNPDMMHINPVRLGNEIGDQFLSFAFMFENMFENKEHNYALVSTIGAMQFVGAVIIGKTMYDAIKSTAIKAKNALFPDEKQKKKNAKAKAMEEAMREAMAENQSRTQPKPTQEETATPKNDNFVDSSSNARSADQVLASIAKFKKQKQEDLQVVPNTPVPGRNNSF
jgi:hypothetical protein